MWFLVNNIGLLYIRFYVKGKDSTVITCVTEYSGFKYTVNVYPKEKIRWTIHLSDYWYMQGRRPFR
jgi:hypothetical protein